MPLSELEKARSDAALGQCLALGLAELLQIMILERVKSDDGDDRAALSSIEKQLNAALDRYEVDAVSALGFREGLRTDIKKRIGIMLRGVIAEAAKNLDVPPPPRPGSH
ncbi:hypothetical protein [Methylobacterium tarhaniae]|uniref:hypothetical protein n=1 Tax=Methylobacterium tarhaniae TaxID=1187852 RepID=UPI003D08016C